MGKKKFYGSLARRIVLIFLLLVLLPLGVHSFLVWDRDHRSRLDTAFSELELLAEANEKIFESWFNHGVNTLEALALLTNEEEDLTNRFEDPNVSGLFSSIFRLDSDFQTDCSSAGEVNIPRPILEEAVEKGQLAFLLQKKNGGRKELFLLKEIDGAMWGLSIDAEEWIKRNGLHLRFVDPALRIDEHLVVLPRDQLENWEEGFSFSEILEMRNKDFAVRMTFPDLLFDLQVDLSSQEIATYGNINFLNHFISLFSLLFVLGGIGAWWLIARMSRPLSQLYEVMNGVSAGDMSLRYQKSRFGFEVNSLGEQFNQMLSSLFRHMQLAKKERIARELLVRELEIGREVQNHLLPKEIPQFPGLTIGTGFVPAKEVGGDFYDLFSKNKNELFLGIADASDKGVSACLYSLIVRSMFRCHILSTDRLDRVASDVNNLFCLDTGTTGEFVTAWVGLYRAEDHLLTYINMGHLPAFLCHFDGTVEELTTKGIALGVTQGANIEMRTKKLQPGQLLVLYTDGVTEAQNEKGELFGKSRLLDFIQSHHASEPQELIDRLIEEIKRFSSTTPQHDDLTVLAMKVN